MTQKSVNSWWAQWTCVGGTCAPAAPAATSSFERALDAYIGLTAPFLRGCVVFVTVAVVVVLSSVLGQVAGLALDAAFFLVAGGYCLANFSRCREAHCMVTGVGWTALAVACAVALATGHDIHTAAWLAFLAIAVVGHGFEAIWKHRHGSNALRLGVGRLS